MFSPPRGGDDDGYHGFKGSSPISGTKLYIIFYICKSFADFFENISFCPLRNSFKEMVSNALLLSSGEEKPAIIGFAYSVSKNTRQGKRISSSAMNSLIQENWGSLINVIRPSISLSLSIRIHIFHHPMRKLPVLQRRSWNRVSLFSCLLGKSPNNCPPGG